MDKKTHLCPILSETQTPALGESTSRSTKCCIVHFTHIASGVLNHLYQMLLSFVWYNRREGLQILVIEPTSQWICCLDWVKRKSQNTAQLRVQWCLLLTPCISLWELSAAPSVRGLTAATTGESRSVVSQRGFVLFLLLFVLPLDVPSGWVFSTQQSWDNETQCLHLCWLIMVAPVFSLLRLCCLLSTLLGL